MFKKSLLSLSLFGVLVLPSFAQEETPTLSTVYPVDGAQIDEDAIFALAFNQRISMNSLAAKAACVIEGVGEQVPVRVLSEDDKQALWEEHLSWVDDNKDNVALVQCSRELPSGAKVALQIQSGLENSQGVATNKTFSQHYVVRAPFSAQFQCERVNAKANCSPLGDVRLQFNSAVKTALAQSKVHLLVDGVEVPAYQEENEKSDSVYSLVYKGPFKPQAKITVQLDNSLEDDMQRPLGNANKFPIETQFDNYPPLLKFATGDFGIIESYAHTQVGSDLQANPALVPLTVRNIEKDIKVAQQYRAGQVAQLRTQNDGQVRKWLQLVPNLATNSYSEHNLRRLVDGLPTEYRADDKEIDARNFAVISQDPATTKLSLPSLQTAQNETEVIGLPVTAPGFYIFEAESPALGAQLTEEARPMYVRSTALVTNIAVHLKTSETGALVWVTRLDDGQPIPNANIRLSACDNKDIATGLTNAQGVFEFKGKLPELKACAYDKYAYMASATLDKEHPMSYGVEDYSFVFSDWDNGIQPWQFNVDDSRYYAYADKPNTLLVHPVLSRTLLRAGEVLDMKHIIRQQTPQGLQTPASGVILPNQLVITLEAMDEEIELPLTWKTAANGGVYADTKWEVPKTAKNGVYSLEYRHTSAQELNIASPAVTFQVEEFKLPFLTGSIQVSAEQQEGAILINPHEMTADIQINYMAGGAAAELPIEVSAVFVPSQFTVPALKDVDFSVVETEARKVFLDKQKLQLDVNGHARVNIENIPPIQGKADLLIEVSFLDPNGQVQTISHTVSAVQAAVMTGIRSASYFEPEQDFTFDVVAVNPLGELQADKKVTVHATRLIDNVVRKRLVGGFYTMESTPEVIDLGKLCEGVTNSQGVLQCTVKLKETGRLNLAASAEGQAFATRVPLWVFKGAAWYTGNDTDRVDVIADKTSYQAGEEAVFDVRIPFAQATALVSIEREGVIDYQLVNFEKNSSSFKLKVAADWSPNVYVSVLSVRGRIRGDVNDMGMAWLNDSQQAQGASTLVDLAKPSFRFGVAKIKVNNPDTQLQLALNLDKSVYQVRDTAKLTIQAKRANGEALARGNVAIFVVDKALLELAQNKTTDLWQAMWPERAWQVGTATAQGEVVGRRHYGRKAVPAGGGGGLAPTRELFDALAFWKSDVVLDEQGQAIVDFKLNDSITQFEVVVIADDGQAAFGTQKIDLASRQDLQIISGLPTLIRDMDKFEATVTLRNTTDKDMTVLVKGLAKKGHRTVAELAEKKVTVLAGRAMRTSWSIEPIHLSDTEGAQSLDWMFEAREQAEKGVKVAHDRIAIKQQLLPYVPVTVRHTQLVQVSDKPISLTVQAPTRAITVDNKIRGGIQVQMQKSLSASLDGVKRYFQDYQFMCFEQQASVAMGLQNQLAWDRLMQESHSYLDDLGLLRYYPNPQMKGSPLLNAYVLAIAAEASQLGWSFALPQQVQEQLLKGLEQVVLGKVKQQGDWLASPDKTDYQLNLLAALARYNLVTPRMLESYPLTESYGAAALVNLYIIHRHLNADTQALATLREALLAKMSRQGDRLVFKDSDTLNKLWWLMEDSNAVHAKLLLAVADDKAWQQDVPYLVQGLLGAQQRGQWGMTTNNLWGTLAMHAFSREFEKTPATGEVNMSMKGAGYDLAQQWNGLSLNQKIVAPWLDKKSAELTLKLDGTGSAWATVSLLAAVDPVEHVYAGYRVEKLIEPVSRRIAGQWSVGDVYRVKLKITAEAPMTWVVVSDPIPSGATILGSGLGRDSAIAAASDTEAQTNTPSFIERKADVFRAYYRFVNEGETTLEYTVRLNTLGKFALPATRVEAMYAPAVFGETVNADMWVK
ncbi:MAG: MG2 domain-containing protein [Pelistega sp.]|nr:MG2 domain-containing protein [Pelistega sp.]